MLGASDLRAQVVRGRVVEASSSAPVPGALVSLLAASGDSTIVSMLTAESGEYGIRAASPGSYRISVKRIGVRRFVSGVFALGDGETRVLDVTVDPIAQALPPVTVSGICVTRPRELARISSLWDEARTALEATEISLRDRLMQARISRYAAELDPTDLQVRFDWRSDAEVMVEQPFTSMSGDSLSAVGYWRVLPGDSVEYAAPDARALSSNAFLHDHCFALAPAPRGRPDLVGLGFSPASHRKLADIIGTIWIDAMSFELRFIEFRYTNLPAELPNADRVGGEVHFARLGSGAWIVDRWFIRMPQLLNMPYPVGPVRQLREEGGTVLVDGVASSPPTASVTGVFRDSANKPVAGAVIRAIGSYRQVVTAADGSYRLDSLPRGGVSIVAHTDGYDAFAMLAGARRVDLQAGRSTRVDIRAPSAFGLRSLACPVPDVPYVQRPVGRGALRVLMIDSATATPMPGVQFVAVWPAAVENPNAAEGTERYRQAVTDTRGAATFCDLPPNIPLDLQLLGPGSRRTHVMMVELPRNGLVSRVIAGKINR
jgi:hypothetical protein